MIYHCYFGLWNACFSLALKLLRCALFFSLSPSERILLTLRLNWGKQCLQSSCYTLWFKTKPVLMVYEIVISRQWKIYEDKCYCRRCQYCPLWVPTLDGCTRDTFRWRQKIYSVVVYILLCFFRFAEKKNVIFNDFFKLTDLFFFLKCLYRPI